MPAFRRCPRGRRGGRKTGVLPRIGPCLEKSREPPGPGGGIHLSHENEPPCPVGRCGPDHDPGAGNPGSEGRVREPGSVCGAVSRRGWLRLGRFVRAGECVRRPSALRTDRGLRFRDAPCRHRVRPCIRPSPTHTVRGSLPRTDEPRTLRVRAMRRGGSTSGRGGGGSVRAADRLRARQRHLCRGRTGTHFPTSAPLLIESETNHSLFSFIPSGD